MIYDSAISDFQNFHFLTPQNPKNKIFHKFSEKLTKIKNWDIKNGIYVREAGQRYKRTKFQSDCFYFDPQMAFINTMLMTKI